MVKCKIHVKFDGLLITQTVLFKPQIVECLFRNEDNTFDCVGRLTVEGVVKQLRTTNAAFNDQLVQWINNKIPFRVYVYLGTPAITKCSVIKEPPILTNTLNAQQKSHIILLSENRKKIYAVSRYCLHPTGGNYVCPICGKQYEDIEACYDHLEHTHVKTFMSSKGVINHKINEWTECRDLRRDALKRIDKYAESKCLHVAFDIETITLPLTDRQVPCVIGWSVEGVRKDLADDLYEQVITLFESVGKRYIVNDKYVGYAIWTTDFEDPCKLADIFVRLLLIVAHIIYPHILSLKGFNNSRFDNALLLASLFNIIPGSPSIVIHGGKIMRLRYRHHSFWIDITDVFLYDAPKTLAKTLVKCDKTFRKGDFEVGRINGLFQVTKDIEGIEECLLYCVQDAVGVNVICEFLLNMCHDLESELLANDPNVNSINLFMTCPSVSSLSYLLWQLLQPIPTIFPMGECLRLTELSVLGGRVSIGAMGHVTGAFIQPDIRSMYGTALQSGYYGAGNFWPVTQDIRHTINLFLASHNTDYIHQKIPWAVGFFYVHLPDDTRILPTVSPRLIRCDVQEGGARKKTLLAEVHSTGDVPIIMNILDAILFSSNGYLVILDKDSPAYYQDGGWNRPFNNYLTQILTKSAYYEQLQDSNKRDAFKLMGNSIAGKCMEKPGTDETSIIGEDELFNALFEGAMYPQYSAPIISKYGSHKYVVKQIVPYYRARGPIQYGTTLLAHSRWMYAKLLQKYDLDRGTLPLDDRAHFLMYSDTDCAQIAVDPAISPGLLQEFLHQHLVSEYDELSCDWRKVASKIEHVSKEFVTLGKKLRAIKLVGDNMEEEVLIKAKGQMVSHLHFNDFLQVWYNREYVETSRISFNHSLHKSTDLKIGMITRQMNICDYICSVSSMRTDSEGRTCAYMFKPIPTCSEAVLLTSCGEISSSAVVSVKDERPK